MFSVEIDKSKRLLVISVAGHVTEAEVREAAQEVREIVTDVSPGFHVLADFRWLDAMDSSAARYVGEIMDAVAGKQVGLVIRVIPDPHKDIGLKILSRFHYGPDFRALTFETIADARQRLRE